MGTGEKGTIISEWIRECIRQHQKKEGKTKLNKSDTHALTVKKEREREDAYLLPRLTLTECGSCGALAAGAEDILKVQVEQ